MSLARRLLMAGGGSGSFAPPVATLTVSTVASSPNGGWTGIPDPKFYVVGDKVFLGWVDSTSGSTEYAHWDIPTETLSTPVALGVGLTDEGPPDNHNSGSVMARSSDGRLVAAYCGHEDARVRVRISTNPGDASAWGAEQVIDPGYGGVYTYCTLAQLSAESGAVYLFARSIPNLGSQTGSLVYATSADGGATWSAWTRLLTGASLKIPYWRIGTNWTDRIDVFATDQAPTASSLYHFYLTGGSRYKSDGTLISTALPITAADLTLIKSNAEGGVFPFGGCWDGAPACALLISLSGTDTSTRVARWRSGAWQVDEVAQAGGVLGINLYGSGAAIHKTDPDIVYVSRKVGARFEMYRYVSVDDGATWTGTQVTTASASDNVWVDTVTNGTSALEALWLYGSYTNDTNFSFGIRGAGYR